MKFRVIIYFLIIAVVFFVSCKSSKTNNTIPQVVYKLDIGPCFGKCPVFLLEIDNNGLAYLDAKRNNKIDGKLKRQLSKEEFASLEKAYKKADLFKLLDEYPTNVADLPSIKITQIKEGKTKTVKANEKMPENYEALLKQLNQVVQKDGWILLEEYKKEEVNEKKDEKLIYEEIIVSFKSGIRLPQWFKDNEANTLRLLKPIDQNSNSWLVTYDKSKFEPYAMLDKLKKDPAVLNAEFNKQIKER